MKHWLQSFRKLICERSSNEAKQRQEGVMDAGAGTRATSTGPEDLFTYVQSAYELLSTETRGQGSLLRCHHLLPGDPSLLPC